MDFSQHLPRIAKGQSPSDRLPTVRPTNPFLLMVHADDWVVMNPDDPYIAPYLRKVTLANGHNGFLARQLENGEIEYYCDEGLFDLEARGWTQVPDNVAGDGSYLRPWTVSGRAPRNKYWAMPAEELYPGRPEPRCNHTKHRAFVGKVLAWMKEAGLPDRPPVPVLQRMLAEAEREQERLDVRNTPRSQRQSLMLGKRIKLLREQLVQLAEELEPIEEDDVGAPPPPPPAKPPTRRKGKANG